MSSDRRGFLRTLWAGAAGAAVAGTCAPEAVAREAKPMPEGAVGLLYDGTLCIGCRACMTACKTENGMPAEFTHLEIGNLWDAPLDISGKTLNVIKAYRSGDASVKDRADDGYCFTKVSCYHCVDPSCVSACPVSAMTKDPVNGIVSYDVDACIGCRYCVAACPFGVPRFTFDEAYSKISKCQLCKHRLPEGKYAACAEACPTGATIFGTVKEIDAEVARRKALKPGTMTDFPRGRFGSGDSHRAPVAKYVDRVYGEKEIGGTQVRHISGVPFELLDKPELPEVPPAAVSEMIQHTLYRGMIAPLVLLGGLALLARKNMRPPTPDEARADVTKGGKP